MTLKISTLSEIKENQSMIMELPGWGIDDTFVCRVKRIDLVSLLKKGKIPNNELLNAVMELFKVNNNEKVKESDLVRRENYVKYLEKAELFAEIALVEPSYKELKDAGIDLTDEQKGIFYNMAVYGVKTLIPFRPKPADNSISNNGENVPQETK